LHGKSAERGILAPYLPLYWPEAEHFHRSTCSDRFFAFLERYPSPHFISTMDQAVQIRQCPAMTHSVDGRPGRHHAKTNSFRDKFERDIAKDRYNNRLRRKAYTATAATLS
jgi:hypothetical protein